jgi:hypothetical protein
MLSPCCLSSCRFEDLGGLEAEHRVSSVGGRYFWRSTREDYMSDFVLVADVAKLSSDGGDGGRFGVWGSIKMSPRLHAR